MNVNMEWLFDIFNSYKNELSIDPDVKCNEGLLTYNEYQSQILINKEVINKINQLENTIKQFIKESNK